MGLTPCRLKDPGSLVRAQVKRRAPRPLQTQSHPGSRCALCHGPALRYHSTAQPAGGRAPVEGTEPGHRHAVLSEQSNGGVEGCNTDSSRQQSESTARPRRSFHNMLLFYWTKREHRHGPPQPGSGRGSRPRGVAGTRASGSASFRVQAPASSPASSLNSDSSLNPRSGPASAPELTARTLGSCGRALAAARARALALKPI